MQRALTLALLCWDLCAPIRVPVSWDSDSEVTKEPNTSADRLQSQNLEQPVPIDYFQYTAKKPQFAVDVAKFHGVQSPEQHFTAHPVRPHTGKHKPELGKHKIQDPNRPVFQKIQEYINLDGEYVKPVSSSYEVFHPYQAEEPGLQELYKDPVLDKIRNDIRDSSQRAQVADNEAGKPNIQSDEYLESLEDTDRKKLPQKNIPARYEIHRPQRRPIYYRPAPWYPNRDQILNHRFRHPWNQNFAKIRPAHYVPLQNHLHRLRQNHALKYDDEHNEYPQVPVKEQYEEPSEGYDIYEKGRAKYIQLRNNLDESVNNVVKENRPSAPQKLELQANDAPVLDEDDEFVPVKNYAQVRKIETTRHLPKSAALDEAETYEEIKNAPRLREAIKSTKAQTVYTEEGYEDSAYDHAGEQKHASDHEGHGGYLKENEKSGGKYKAPSVSGSFEDGKGSEYRDQTIHGNKWDDDKKESNKEEDSEDYSEDENEQDIEADSYEHGPAKKIKNQRNKRQHEAETDRDSKTVITSESVNDPENVEDSESSSGNNVSDSVEQNNKYDDDDNSDTNSEHDVNKRETKDFKVPEINLESVYTADKEIAELTKEKLVAKDTLKEKYPYYSKNLKTVNQHSPLRYAENLKFIPKKSKGGTEFYESRSQLECPEVDDKVDAIPEKLKKNGHPDEEDDNEEDNNKKDIKKGETGPVEPRLSGLGDKIDCFKAKYFGENPLDSPFFKEEIISNPEPITVPSNSAFKLKSAPLLDISASNAFDAIENLRNNSQNDIFELLNKLTGNQNILIDSVTKGTEELKNFASPLSVPLESNSTLLPHSNVYSDIIKNIKHNQNVPLPDASFSNGVNQNKLQEKLLSNTPEQKNGGSHGAQNKDEIVTSSIKPSRKKRGAPFVYEPYKIIRDGQTPDSKKTTTTSNISPLIKQLQSSKVIDAVVKDQPVKRTVGGRTYKDIGRKEREKSGISTEPGASFVDFSVDKRRGEPRYEIRLSNHKSQYSPVENKKAMSVEDYEAQTHSKLDGRSKANSPKDFSSESEGKKPTPRALYDIAKFRPKSEEVQRSAASNTIKTTIATTSAPVTHRSKNEPPVESDDDSDEEYDEEYDEDDDAEDTHTTSTTTTTTTAKPIFRRRIRTTTTTEKEEDITEEPVKLRLVTRFHTTPAPRKHKKTTESTTKPTKKYDDSEELPKYREKKKKSSKSTMVTDTKKYGDDDEDDMRKEEIDALIGVKHDMDEYMPMYEKEAERNKEKEADSSEEDDSDEDEDDDDDDEEDDEEDDDEDEDVDEKETASPKPIVTTEVPKRTLARTTDAPPSTTETRNSKSEVKPVVTKKKIEIHKEIPVNKSSPHITQYKQDIEEEEIIREIPRKIPERKLKKNIELLDLYKDENLAKDINQLGGVEVFKENLDLKSGPKHGGNYRRAPDLKEEPEVTTAQTIRRRTSKPAKDAVTSQSENKKHIELNDDDILAKRLHGGNLKSANDFKRSRNKSEKLIELTTETQARAMHGGHLKATKERGGKRSDGRSAKLIELDESYDDDDDSSSDSMHGGNFKSYGSRGSGRGSKFHGGNYKSAKLVADDNEKGETKSLAENSKASDKVRNNAAVVLNSFAQVAPILTSTPRYILDPSKRMYYYVD